MAEGKGNGARVCTVVASVRHRGTRSQFIQLVFLAVGSRPIVLLVFVSHVGVEQVLA